MSVCLSLDLEFGWIESHALVEVLEQPTRGTHENDDVGDPLLLLLHTLPSNHQASRQQRMPSSHLRGPSGKDKAKEEREKKRDWERERERDLSEDFEGLESQFTSRRNDDRA